MPSTRPPKTHQSEREDAQHYRENQLDDTNGCVTQVEAVDAEAPRKIPKRPAAIFDFGCG